MQYPSFEIVCRTDINNRYCLFLQGKGKSAKNARKGQNPEAAEEEYKKCPHSMVIHRGNVGVNVRRLVKDFRMVMEPFTAVSLKVMY